jgi:formiminotetrahydrofolate cyclodeaminase
MDFRKLNLEEFVEALGSKAPTPGGGGASAMAGALGVALGGMVASLTIGKPKYAHVEEDMKVLADKIDRVQRELLELINKDAEAFEPLSRAYGLPQNTEKEKAEKEVIMEVALRKAAEVPLIILEKCCEAVDLLEEAAEKGSRLVISDAGTGAIFCKAAMQGAVLNVLINTSMMKDETLAAAIETKLFKLLAEYLPKAEEIYNSCLTSYPRKS